MSKETIEWLNTQTLVGFTDKRGDAWHFEASAQGEESNHYSGAIPVEDVLRRLFHWSAISAPVQATFTDPMTGQEVIVSDAERQAIIRPDTADILGLFKSGYMIHQYPEWLLERVATLLDADLHIASAGLLERGGMAWVQVEMAETLEHAASGEKMRPFLLCTTSHNGKLASTFKLCIQRVVCDNTQRVALSEDGSEVKVKHSRYSDLHIARSREVFGLFESASIDYWTELDAMLATPVTNKQFISWRDAMVPLPEKDGRAKTMAERKRDAFSELWVNDSRVAPWNGNAWGIYQTASTYAQHVAPVHSGTVRTEKNIFGAATGKLFDSDKFAMATLAKVLETV